MFARQKRPGLLPHIQRVHRADPVCYFAHTPGTAADSRRVLQLPFHGECLTAASSVTARFAALGYGE